MSVEAVILFIDLINSSRYAEALSEDTFLRLIDEFNGIAEEISGKYGTNGDAGPKAYVYPRGEEILVILPIQDGDSDQIGPFRMAIEIAYYMKVRILETNENCQQRIMQNKPPVNVAIGLHFGTVHPKSVSGNIIFVGAALHFGKRVEQISRRVRSTGIAISQSFVTMCQSVGVPIEVGSEVKINLKGFASPEPVYEMRSQYCTNLLELQRQNPLSVGEFPGWVQQVVHRDPLRYSWLMELIIDGLFLENPDKVVRDIAPKILFSIRLPSILYRFARCYHRSSWTDSPDMSREPTMNPMVSHAIDLYRASGEHFIWGKLDQAASHWKIASNAPVQKGRSYIRENNRLVLQYPKDAAFYAIGEFDKAINLCDEVIGIEPRHFFAYNLRALCIGEFLEFLSVINDCSVENYEYLNQVNSMLMRARMDLDQARMFNGKPEYLYQGTEASIDFASAVALPGENQQVPIQESRGKILNTLDVARRELGDPADSLSPEDYWQEGFAVPSAMPPRKKQLLNQWKKKEEYLAGE